MKQMRAARPYLLLTILIAIPVLIYLHHGIGANDSNMFRTGATLCGPGLYRWDLQRPLLGAMNTPFFRAPFYAFALRPLLALDFPLALLVLNLAAAAATIALLPLSLGKYPYKLTPLLILYTPLAYNLSIEQDGAIVLLILSLTLALESAGFPFIAGAVLALTLEKPSLFLLLPVVIAFQKKFRMLSGYLACAAFLGVISLWITGPRALHDYLSLLAAYQLTPEKMPTARGLSALLHAPILWPILTVLTVAAVIYTSTTQRFRPAFLTAVIASVFISPQSYSHDLAILLLPVLYFLFTAPVPTRILCALTFLPLVPFVYLYNSPLAVLVPLTLTALLLTLIPPRAATLRPCTASS